MTASARAFVVQARAKFNVRLEVGAKRTDGFHPIRSVVAELAVADDIEFTPAQAFSVACDDPAIREEINLAHRAAMALPVSLPPVRVFITKRIPVQAGLGGGSADAAATLRGIASVLGASGVTVDEDTLVAAAARSGSDVAACLFRGFKLVEGRGETVRPLDVPAPPWGVLLLKPAAGIDTAAAYRILDEARGPAASISDRSIADVERLVDALRASDLRALRPLVRNDFQAPIEAAFPTIADARRRLENAGARASVLCGSGACVAGLFDTVDAARDAAGRLAALDGEWVCATGFAA